MPRTLTSNERAVLAHVCEDPDAWWAHVNTITKFDVDRVLADKVATWQASYDAADNKVRANRVVDGETVPAEGSWSPVEGVV